MVIHKTEVAEFVPIYKTQLYKHNLRLNIYLASDTSFS